MPNDGTNLLEVPGNRLPETGSRQMKILHIRGSWNLLCNLKLRSIEARIGKLLKGLRHYDLKIGNLQDKQSIGPDFPATAEGQSIGRDINRINIFFNVPIEPRKSTKAGLVVSSRDIPFVIQPKQIIEAPR
ncbi:hypothetical protein GQ457_01G018630 [Hibiscus cannabinus]